MTLVDMPTMGDQMPDEKPPRRRTTLVAPATPARVDVGEVTVVGAPEGSTADLVNEIERIASDAAVPADEFLASNGLRLKLYKVSSMLVSEAGRRIPDVPVPVVFIEDKGREEENPHDPAYIEAQRDVDWKRTVIIMNTTIAFGTKPIEPLPDNLEPVEATSWAEDVVEIAGVSVPSKGRGRYAAWLQYYALPDNTELMALQLKVGRLSGRVPEADVAAAEDSFRDSETRTTP